MTNKDAGSGVLLQYLDMCVSLDAERAKVAKLEARVRELEAALRDLVRQVELSEAEDIFGGPLVMLKAFADARAAIAKAEAHTP